jgi:hypothetical protein
LKCGPLVVKHSQVYNELSIGLKEIIDFIKFHVEGENLPFGSKYSQITLLITQRQCSTDSSPINLVLYSLVFGLEELKDTIRTRLLDHLGKNIPAIVLPCKEYFAQEGCVYYRRKEKAHEGPVQSLG